MGSETDYSGMAALVMLVALLMMAAATLGYKAGVVVGKEELMEVLAQSTDCEFFLTPAGNRAFTCPTTTEGE